LAVAQLRTKLIDLTRRSPLISFKHGGRASNLVRIVDERPDLVFAGLGEGAWVSSRCPGRTPRRATATDAFRIAYENALLVDETFLAATEKLGDDERDAEAWQRAERRCARGAGGAGPAAARLWQEPRYCRPRQGPWL
jgi:hypothetical protein